jgi:hypothetical protein
VRFARSRPETLRPPPLTAKRDVCAGGLRRF